MLRQRARQHRDIGREVEGRIMMFRAGDPIEAELVFHRDFFEAGSDRAPRLVGLKILIGHRPFIARHAGAPIRHAVKNREFHA